MKKLIIAAAVAAISVGSFANLCTDDPVVTGCALYDVKVSFKTLGPKALNVKNCGDETLCGYFENATRTFEGVIWDCIAVCGTLNNTTGANFVLWEKAQKEAVSLPLVWDDIAGEWVADTLTFAVIDRYSKKATKVEAAWAFVAADGLSSWTAAGFGTYDAKNEVVKSISGNAAGILVPVQGSTKCADYDGMVVDFCTDFDDWCTDGEVPDFVAASGTWSIKYNKSLSTGSKSLARIVPSYAQQ